MNDTDIGLGDVVSFGWKDGYADGTVCETHKDGTVDVFRIYVHAGDFACAGSQEGSKSVITYVGSETIRSINPKRLTRIRKGGDIR